MPAGASLYRPPSAEALELLGAVSGSLPPPEHAESQDPTPAAEPSAADSSPPAVDPALAATPPAEPAAAAEAPKPTPPKARRLVKPAASPAMPPEDAFVGLPDDVLHGNGDLPPQPANASSTIVEPASSLRSEPPAKSPDASPTAQASAEPAPPAAADADVPQSPLAPAAAAAEEAAFAPQTPEVSATEAAAPAQAAEPVVAAEDPPAAVLEAAPAAEPLQPEEAPQAAAAPPVEQTPLESISRDNQTPYMERKLRNLQVCQTLRSANTCRIPVLQCESVIQAGCSALYLSRSATKAVLSIWCACAAGAGLGGVW